jgi:hypothetical protein
MFDAIKRGGRSIVLNAGPPGMDAPLGGAPGGLAREMLSTLRDLKAEYYTAEGRVDYTRLALSAEYAGYKSMAARLQGFDLGTLVDDASRLAFWINLYNTLVVDGIIALGIKDSVKEVRGFFHRVKYSIGSYEFSPDDIEHGILRANSRPYMRAFRQFGPFDARRRFALAKPDPRIHFALVCGARSCAPIKFYTPEKIYAELDTAAMNFINSSEVVVMPEEGRVVISMILKWYERDFGGASGVLDFIERYLVDGDKKMFIRDEKPKIKTEYLPYDWDLNA